MNRFSAPVPVILDTDIGTDIDDAWALAMLLRCPELALRLVVTASGDTRYRARAAAAILAAGGRDDVPLGIGPPNDLPAHLPQCLHGRPMAAVADTVDLDGYRGGVRSDGVEALVECIMESPEPVTLIAIGPMTNVAAAIALEPRIVQNARLVAMLGSVHKGLNERLTPEPEYNVLLDVPACRSVFAADWEVTITPLDTCGSVVLDGERYRSVRSSAEPLAQMVMRSYRGWDRALSEDHEGIDRAFYVAGMSERRSTVLFDTVAVYLAYDESLLEIETLPISVADDGRTRISPGAPKIRVATNWQAPGFLDHLTHRLVAGASRS